MAVDAEGSPVTVSWSGDSRRNIIVWMDHRAVKQAERINSFNSPVLQYCGGGVSPEMEPPKVGGSFLDEVICFCLFEHDEDISLLLQLLWVKENLQESWSMVYKWMDLSDWLSYRCCSFNLLALLSLHSLIPFCFLLELLEMILVVCAPQCANGRILVMRICNR